MFSPGCPFGGLPGKKWLFRSIFWKHSSLSSLNFPLTLLPSILKMIWQSLHADRNSNCSQDTTYSTCPLVLDKVFKMQNRLYYCEDEKIYFLNVEINFSEDCFQTELHDLQTSNKMFDFKVHVSSMIFTQKSPLLPPHVIFMLHQSGSKLK